MGVRVDSGRPHRRRHASLLPVAPLDRSTSNPETDTASATATRADSAGIEIITNTGTDRPLGWTLDSILVLRAPTEAGGDTVGFFDVTDVAITSGRIVVLDRSQSALVVHDTLGHLLGRHGRKGSGPGEFSMPL